MNIDKVIEILQDTIKKLNGDMEIKHTNYNKAKAIKTLINEYNNLKQIEEAHRIENGKLRERINKIEKYVRSNKWSEDYKNSSCRTSILRILEED